jgi:hypothetical protein
MQNTLLAIALLATSSLASIREYPHASLWHGDIR